MNVSRSVSLHVQSDVSPDAEIISAKKRNRKLKKRSSGLYLVRSGGIYLFQKRLPKRIGGGAGSRPVRISLGAIPHQKARETADALAALARNAFREIEKRMGDPTGFDLSSMWSALFAEDIAADDWPFEFATLILKGGLFDLDKPARPPTPEEAKGLELMRGLVRIGQQVSAKQAGQPYDEMIADNAEMLVTSHIGKYDKAVLPTPVPEQLYTSTKLLTVPVPSLPDAPTEESVIITPAGRRKQRLISADVVPAFMLDRRSANRPPSTKVLFSAVASEYLAARRASKLGKNNDIETAESRLNLFVELIGDHPVDTYTATDLQAFIEFLKFWPSNAKDRPDHLSAREIVDSNRDLRSKPLARKTLEEGYLAVIKSALNSGQTTHDYKPIVGAKLKYPDTARPAISAEPLGNAKIQKLFETGVASGFLDNAMLPLLALLTGRRLGLLVHLTGNDIREKFEGVWVAQTAGIIQHNNVWKRIPIKNDASMRFFVLHDFLVEIGFIEWARAQKDKFLFRELIRLADPSKSASSYMGRLFQEAKIKEAKGERFHSLRSGFIAEAGEQNIEKRNRQMQVGHEIGDDEHDKYGFLTLTEKAARVFATMPINSAIDLSMFRGLDFDKLARAARTRGRNVKDA
jgi:integrase